MQCQHRPPHSPHCPQHSVLTPLVIPSHPTDADADAHPDPDPDPDPDTDTDTDQHTLASPRRRTRTFSQSSHQHHLEPNALGLGASASPFGHHHHHQHSRLNSPKPTSPDAYRLQLPVSPYRTAPIQILVKNQISPHHALSRLASFNHNKDDHHAQQDHQAAVPLNHAASSASTAHHMSDGISHPTHVGAQEAHSSPDPDEDGVWEDEDDESPEHDDLGAVTPALDSDASEGDASADEEVRQQRAAYRDAVQQYRRSRKALLLSGISSYASTPSPESHRQTSALLRQSHSPTPQPPDSVFGRHPIHSDRYLSASNAEPIDAADPPGRAHDAVFVDHHSDGPDDNGLSPSSESYEEDSSDRDGHKPSPHQQADVRLPDLGDQQQQQQDATLSNKVALDAPNSSGAASDQKELCSSESPTPTTNEQVGSPMQASRAARELDEIVATLSPRSEKRTIQDVPVIRAHETNEPAGNAGAQSVDQAPYEDSTDQAKRETGLQLATPSTRARDLLQPSTFRDGSGSIKAASQERPQPLSDDLSAAENTDGADRPKVGEAAVRTQASVQLPSKLDSQAEVKAPFSLWDYLQEEVLATDFDSTQELKWERVTNFIAIPFWMEKIIMFGFVVCLDSFLYTFTILPIRFVVALYKWISNSVTWMLGGDKRYLHSSHKCDLLKCLLIVLSCIILSRITDASKMYHSVRGQDVVKLSVIFNVLEIADRLCCSFGQDLLDSLFSRITLARRKNGKQPYIRPLGFLVLSLGYILAHTLVLFYQLVTLNVAINSYDNALLTLLLSNQFVEIKGSVFKKFEKENVFQMTCADIVERFQLTLMLTAIGLRNLIELSGGMSEGGASPLPASFTVFPSLSLLETVLTPLLIVLMSECFVDWLKHAFITKFNHIRPAVYGRFMDVLCRDLVVGGPSQRNRKHTFVDQSPIVSRRLGFAALPLACLLIRITVQVISMIGDTSHIDECALPAGLAARNSSLVGSAARKLMSVDIDSSTFQWLDLVVRASTWTLTLVIAWAFLVAVKLLLGANLVSYASHRYATMHQRENEENLNSKDRAPIGVDKDELSYDKKLVQLVDRSDDNAIQIMLDGRHVPPAEKGGKPDGASKEKKTTSLMDVSRYTMVRSRIW
ncbi:hypothetical protein ACQY0O_001548 [Thecaphora frezii]